MAKTLPSVLFKTVGALLVATLLFKPYANGIVFYDYTESTGGTDDKNQSIPDSERADIFNAVARVCDENGENTSGSATYIRGKYLLTADHVSNGSHVTFDGITFYERDTAFVPRQIFFAGENVDLKLIKLVEIPKFSGTEIEIDLNTDAASELPLFNNTLEVTLVGWGVGRDPNIDNLGSLSTNIWTWGNQTTLAKRWGTNNIENAVTSNFGFNNKNYAYEALYTNLLPQFFSGKSEAGIARFDSGSGMFAKIGDKWRLVGIATLVASNSGENTSTFSSNPSEKGSPTTTDDSETVVPYADQNFFVRISSYAAAIEAAISDTSTYSGWKVYHNLYGTDAIDTADTDGDGINQLLEFAFGGSPHQNDTGILPTSQLVQDGNETYLEITLTRPKWIQDITYTPQITTDFSKWTNLNESGFANEFTISNPIDNNDGTESLNYRFKLTVAKKIFVRFQITESS